MYINTVTMCLLYVCMHGHPHMEQKEAYLYIMYMNNDTWIALVCGFAEHATSLEKQSASMKLIKVIQDGVQQQYLCKPKRKAYLE